MSATTTTYNQYTGASPKLSAIVVGLICRGIFKRGDLWSPPSSSSSTSFCTWNYVIPVCGKLSIHSFINHGPQMIIIASLGRVELLDGAALGGAKAFLQHLIVWAKFCFQFVALAVAARKRNSAHRGLIYVILLYCCGDWKKKSQPAEEEIATDRLVSSRPAAAAEAETVTGIIFKWPYRIGAFNLNSINQPPEVYLANWMCQATVQKFAIWPPQNISMTLREQQPGELSSADNNSYNI